MTGATSWREEEFGAVEIDGGPWCRLPGGIVIKDAIADAFLQQILTRPKEYAVIATTNLNGDYISDALAAQVGGIGIAPGANINYDTGHAIFEATHGTAPKYASQDKVNPGSVILSGEMMFRYLGWNEAADLIIASLERTIAQKRVTYDFERLMPGRRCSRRRSSRRRWWRTWGRDPELCGILTLPLFLSDRCISRRSLFVGRPLSGRKDRVESLELDRQRLPLWLARLGSPDRASPRPRPVPSGRRARAPRHILVRTPADPDLVAHLDRTGALGAVAVDLDLPAVDRVGGE